MVYSVEIAPVAVRQLRKLDPPGRRRIQAAIELLAADPRPPGAEKLVGGEAEWRIRTGDYRVVYEIHDDALVVLVLAVLPEHGSGGRARHGRRRRRSLGA
jgi:mRNA interferase RelE/StbE